MNRLTQAIQKNGSGPLLGAAAYFYDPTFLEIAALVGYQVAWIEMEHTFITFAEAADLCRIASGLGMLTMIRIPDTNRTTVLKAAECGPDILDLPMVNSPEELCALVHHARFPPAGIRGYFSVSRAVGYGLAGNISEIQQRLNRELCLMVQVETREAVDRADELCAVDGVEGIFLGPADLSASLGVPGQTGHPSVFEAAERTIRAARSAGKQVAVAAAPDDFPFWVNQDVDLLFCTNDIACLKVGAQAAIRQARTAIEQARTNGRRGE
jgi:4-hydroxy-2-oxoheptanedioate aldolase